MLNVDLAHALHHQRRLDFEGHAQHARLGHEFTTPRRSSRAVRVHVGWWLVATGLRLAVWDRRPTAGPYYIDHPAVRSLP